MCRKTEESVSMIYSKGITAQKTQNFAMVEESIRTLDQLESKLGKHIKSVGQKADFLRSSTRESFMDLCSQLKDVLLGKSSVPYKGLFLEYQNMVLDVSHVLQSDDAKKAFNLTNQLFCEKLLTEVTLVRDLLSFEDEALDFLEIKSKVEDARIFGGFVADYYTLFSEKMKKCEYAVEDQWLDKITAICHEHFGGSRDYSKMKYFVILNVVPSASKEEIKAAYKVMAKKTHPDKVNGQGEEVNAKFRQVKEAWEALENDASAETDRPQAFERMVCNVGHRLREECK